MEASLTPTETHTHETLTLTTYLFLLFYNMLLYDELAEIPPRMKIYDDQMDFW